MAFTRTLPCQEAYNADVFIQVFPMDSRPLADQAPMCPFVMGSVFEARFVRQLTQREAASTLGISRTTLAYQEHRIRKLLRKHLLGTNR